MNSKQKQGGFIKLSLPWYCMIGTILISLGGYLALSGDLSKLREDNQTLQNANFSQKLVITDLEGQVKTAENVKNLLMGQKKDLEEAVTVRDSRITELSKQVESYKRKLPVVIRPNSPEDTPTNLYANSQKRIETLWALYCEGDLEKTSPGCKGASK